MCRSIKQLRRAEAPASEEELRAAALQFVRKITGYRVPSSANAPAFFIAVEEVASASRKALLALETRTSRAVENRAGRQL